MEKHKNCNVLKLFMKIQSKCKVKEIMQSKEIFMYSLFTYETNQCFYNIYRDKKNMDKQ